jgi:hypothetical protein
MRWLALFIIILALAAGCAKTPPSAEQARNTFFVATNGNDAWSGQLPTPNRQKTDGPFATLSRALNAVRQARASGAVSGRANVSLRSGIYFLESAMVLQPADSDLEIAAYGNEQPVLSGGRRIVFRAGEGPLWKAEVPQARGGQWIFRELWINGARAIRARHPNRGYLAIADMPDKTSEWSQGQTRFQYREQDLQPWTTLTNAELVAMTRWVESRLPVREIDPTNRVVSFSKKSVFQLSAGDLYYLENAREALDQPGEWYLDPWQGILSYHPRADQQLEKVEAIAPTLTQLVRFEGTPDSGKFVERVRFRGITFSHSEWYFPPGFQTGKNKPEVSPPPQAEIGGFSQAAIGVPGAVWGEGVRQCTFEQCSFFNLGSYGLELGRGCQSNRIVRCEFANLGAGGIKIGETRIRTTDAEESRANEITDCHVHDGGKMFHSAIGIWIGQSPDNVIAHNLIHDFYYTGISIGWTWGYGPALATNNLVAFNHVHHIGISSDGDGPILSDMGGIYTLGRQPGTTIRSNLWHDIAAFRYGGWGIYFDEGSSEILAEKNLVYRTTHGGFHQHYGATNIFRNNIIAFARDHQIQRTRPEPHPSFSFETNIVYFDSGSLLTGDWSKDTYRIDRNLYFDTRSSTNPTSMLFANETLEKWRQRGHDVHSVIGDPLFVAPQKGDFKLHSNSPAFQIGFQPFDLSRVGPRTSKP